MSTVEFTRIAPGHYRATGYDVRREATGEGIRRASHPMWFVYTGGVRLPGRYRTLAEAQRHVRVLEATR